VTKVLFTGLGLRFATSVLVGVCCLSSAHAAEGAATDKPAETLYLQLGQVGLDPGRVYHVRDQSLDRSSVHITLEDGSIGFTQDVMGRITGAFFEGDGEVLVTPPNRVERDSMALFTGMAILEEHFSTAYFRFNDDTATQLRPGLRAADDQEEFVERWNETAKNLAQADAMRLLVSFSRMLPVKSDAKAEAVVADVGTRENRDDRFLHARLQGTTLGVFDVYFDASVEEQVLVGQTKASESGAVYYNVWTSFSPIPIPRSGVSSEMPSPEAGKEALQGWITVRRYVIQTQVTPPKAIHARVRAELEVRQGGERTILFELSRFLQIESVKLEGQPVEFIHNPAVEGTHVARLGNDIVAVILPEPVQAGQKINLEFVYGGDVLAEEGSGLLYVGARGTWFPSRGLVMADFDLEFEYPEEWTLVATGKPVPVSAVTDMTKVSGEEISHWISERPIPVAGFNLGKYKVARTQAGDVKVETYATQNVEKSFPGTRIETIEPDPLPSLRHPPARPPEVIVPTHRPSPARNEVPVGEAAARAIQYYAERFGPYPYSSLALTQMPGHESQGWPGLVFLSSYAFLNQQEQEDLHLGPYRILLQEIMPAHETAHQWWGDLITWTSYRDQWLSEGLANYSALMMLQEKDPAGFHVVMEKYRHDLMEPNKEGIALKDAGPVTLGLRLLSSRFPEGYEAISYGRGTWLFHMLRTMLRDAAAKDAKSQVGTSGTDEPFVRALRRVRERYEGKSISTRELLDVFAEDLPPSLRYEGKNSLEWFLDGWVNGTALPKLELRAVKFVPKGAGTVVSGTILQKDAPEDLVTSVPVYAVGAGRQLVLLGRVFADGEESSFHVSAPARTNKVVLDPYETILTSPK